MDGEDSAAEGSEDDQGPAYRDGAEDERRPLGKERGRQVTLDDFVNQCASDCVNAHVTPEPEQRSRYTRAQQQGRIKAWQSIAYSGENVISYGTLCAAIDIYEESLRQAHRNALGAVR